MRQFSLRLLLSVCLIIVGITGTAWAAVAPETPVNLTTLQWVGHNFVFLALPADKQADGYGIFAADQAAQGFQEDRTVRLSYLQNVGKLVTVTDVTPYTAGDNKYDYVVAMTEIGTGYKFVGRTSRGSLEGLALAEDITKARQQFLGKTIYPKSRSLEAVNAQPGGMNPASVTIRIGSAVTVTDVYAGIQSREPIWLIVSANGQQAILPIAYSWTNQNVSNVTQNPPWKMALFMDDPRTTLGWSTALWTQIESGSVQEGMTKDQVRLSWGPPNRVDQGAAGSVWLYGTKTLKFTGDQLTSMETVVGPTP
ncbi:MAG: hypothetical protein P4N59_23125 [Negativicutes bacterium]|nr:hypothetical protein [Negativicutes bacterium]